MKLRRYAAGAAVIAAYLALGAAAHAQFTLPQITGVSTAETVPGQSTRSYTNIFGFSPYTSFQFTQTQPPDANGQVNTRKYTENGPMLLAEKSYRLKAQVPGDPSHLDLGAWYWFSTSSDHQDRYALYAKYFYNHLFGAQLSAGGDKTGFLEYYSFLLYNPLVISQKTKVGVQLGIGPYFPKEGLGNTGYTGFASAGYKLSNIFSVNASYWYINFTRPQKEFGITKTNGLTRTALSFIYTSP